jgi:2-oxoglutarate dehydrogenase E1 component
LSRSVSRVIVAGESLLGDQSVLDAFRRWGYLQADLDPLGIFRPLHHPELNLKGGAADAARRFYCGTIGAEFMHIPEPERRRWVQERMEAEPASVDAQRVLDRLVHADIFEQMLQKRYLGTKRYSLEGTTALIPLLDEILDVAGALGAEEAVLAMAHRGRLNVIVNVVGRDPAEVFAGFEDIDPRSILGSGDVKYHLGATGTYETPSGRKLRMHLVSNPSHLEAVDPVVAGRVRAKQTRLGLQGKDPKAVLPVVMHGDAAFAGQGIWAETLNFAGIRGFEVGGSLHVIINNLIGFTTTPKESHTARFAAELAKRNAIPIFHVNGEDLDAVVRVARLAAEYRYQFQSDVVVDLIGYRRHGHSEVDDPTITQPIVYRAIKDHPPLYEIFAEDHGLDPEPLVAKVRRGLEDAQKRGAQLETKPRTYTLPPYWSPFTGGVFKPEYEVATGVSREELREVTEKLTSYPDGFRIHPKIRKLLEQRAEMGRGERPVDYGMAEALAFATLLRQGTPVRLSGQDSRRGTFNQRHAVLVDTEDESEFIPLEHVAEKQAWFEIYNSTLSEAGVLGFEYGFSRDYPEALVLWEAQFGDFANGAQIIIDQFISAGEDKWGLLSGLVLLLPHGYEGQGPEHSSARIERFMQLAAEDNMQLCQPSTAAQYFHMLRRQSLRKWRKPLIVFTPKSMLRHPAASSDIAEFERERFLNVIPDDSVSGATRVLVASGKVLHELREERKRRQDESVAIVALEQIYPFPEQELAAAIEHHAHATEVVWVQEEPRNMGPYAYVLPRLRRMMRSKHVRSVKRAASASPATGSAKAHELEQKTLLSLAFLRAE